MADNNAVTDIKEIKAINKVTFKQRMISYKRRPLSLVMLILVAVAAFLSAAALIFLIVYILVKGVPNLTPDLFAWEYNSDNVSCMPAIINTVIITFLTLLIAVPFGIGAAIYLAEYAKKGNKLVKVIRTMAETLSGIPSIVYGLFGMMCFVTALHWNLSLLAGGFTLAIMVLPTIMRTTEEALLTVPDSYREGSYGLGAGKLRTIIKIILPSAMPGILAGIILAVGRIVGETAALIYTAGSATGTVSGVMDSGRTLAIHMYVLANEGLYTNQAWGTAVVLLVLVFGINTLSAFIAKKLGSKKG
ncbi:MAG: phosphate ABC transporter permease PstA [Oscillospiraceae bacterium]|nr:phosphate ABC transporter permease PstA [Oscillospiraceae bacterium]